MKMSRRKDVPLAWDSPVQYELEGWLYYWTICMVNVESNHPKQWDFFFCFAP